MILTYFLPSFDGLAATRERAAEMFVEYCASFQEKRNDSWTRNYAIGSDMFVKKVLRDNGLINDDPPAVGARSPGPRGHDSKKPKKFSATPAKSAHRPSRRA